MPRYFFNVVLDGTTLADPNGQELPDADAAWEVARRSALDLMKSDLGRPMNWVQCRFEVRDDANEVVLEFPFVEAVETRGLLN